MPRYELVAFDMDGTLVKERNSWGALHRHFGTMEQARENLREYAGGKINYAEFMRRDAALWLPFRPTMQQITDVLSNYELTPYAAKVIKELRNRGVKTALITGGLNVLARSIAHRLGIEHVMANDLVCDAEGRLTGEEVFNVDVARKDEVLCNLMRKLRIPTAKCIAVGDSKYDITFLKCAGLGIAFNPDPELIKHASIVVRDLRDILKHV
ncbi:MAG: HAD family phosphatase [Methanocellales archaeon]|nr:HAD family phosphatase [Methanocellales archaeon]